MDEHLQGPDGLVKTLLAPRVALTAENLALRRQFPAFREGDETGSPRPNHLGLSVLDPVRLAIGARHRETRDRTDFGWDRRPRVPKGTPLALGQLPPGQAALPRANGVFSMHRMSF
jgi:hypothetical protein